jgi:alanine racemase
MCRMPMGTACCGKPADPGRADGQRAPLVGRVSMDMIAVDITVLNGVHVGTPVVLWGVGLPVEEIARYAERLPTSCCVE